MRRPAGLTPAAEASSPEETVVRPKPMVEVGGRPILWSVMAVDETSITEWLQPEGALRVESRPLNIELAEKGKMEGFNYMADRSLWERVPTFSHRPPQLGSVWRAYLPDLGLAAAWAALATLALAVSARAMGRP